MNQVTAALTTLALHGIELPNVPTKIVVPYEDTVYVMLDMSSHPELLQQTLSTIPADFSRVDRSHEDNPFHVGSLMLLTTRVTFRVYEYDQDFSA